MLANSIGIYEFFESLINSQSGIRWNKVIFGVHKCIAVNKSMLSTGNRPNSYFLLLVHSCVIIQSIESCKSILLNRKALLIGASLKTCGNFCIVCTGKIENRTYSPHIILRLNNKYWRFDKLSDSPWKNTALIVSSGLNTLDKRHLSLFIR